MIKFRLRIWTLRVTERYDLSLHFHFVRGKCTFNNDTKAYGVAERLTAIHEKKFENAELSDSWRILSCERGEP